MADKTLLVLLDEARHKTLSVLEGVDDQHARWAPPGLHNTMLWHAGHCYVVVEWLIAQAIGQRPISPAGWFEMFSWESRPERIAAHRWPPLSSVVWQLQEQHRRLHEVLGRLSDEQLDAPSPGSSGRSVRAYIVHAIQDEICHSGEMWLLRKMLAARAK